MPSPPNVASSVPAAVNRATTTSPPSTFPRATSFPLSLRARPAAEVTARPGLARATPSVPKLASISPSAEAARGQIVDTRSAASATERRAEERLLTMGGTRAR